jgi:hypothetical protein
VEILERCRDLIEKVEIAGDKLDNVQIALSREQNLEKLEKLWAEEFNLMMTLAAASEDAMAAIDELEEKEGMTFICTRMRQRLSTLHRGLVVNV